MFTNGGHIIRLSEAITPGKQEREQMAAFGKMNPEFNAIGTSTKEKLDRAIAARDAAIENLKIATGVKDWTDTMLTLAMRVAEAETYRAHWQGQVDKAEAERKAREEQARRERAQREALDALLRKHGGDFEKVLAAIRTAAEKTEEK